MLIACRKIADFFLDVIRSAFLLLATTLIPVFSGQRTHGAKKKVLVIRLDAIGDFILWLDSARELRRLYPPDLYEITLLGNHLWTPLAEGHPFFDRVWPLQRKKYLMNPVYCLGMIAKVHREGFDLAINPAYSREFKFGDILAKASGAPERIGSRGNSELMQNWQKVVGDRFYTRLIPARAELLMELLRNGEFVRGLGAEGFRASVPELTGNFALPTGFTLHDYVVIVPGASLPVKQWPVDRFREIALRLRRETGRPVVVCGGASEEALGIAMLEAGTIPIENWCGKTSLTELVAVLAGAFLVVANDTGAVHLAAALSVPVVCITGGGHPDRFLPYRIEVESDRPLPVSVVADMDCSGCNWRHCVHGAKTEAAPCMMNIAVDAVWKAISARIHGPV